MANEYSLRKGFFPVLVNVEISLAGSLSFPEPEGRCADRMEVVLSLSLFILNEMINVI